MIVQLSFAQKQAITEDGDTIYIFNDGTWSYSPDDFEFGEDMAYLSEEIVLDTIETIFTTPKNAKKKLTSKLGFFSFYFDEKKWKRIPVGQLNEDGEFGFQHRNNDIYCVIISEEIEIGLENIYRIARNNLSTNSTEDVETVVTELRNVNGEDLIRGSFNATFAGIKMTFDSYYYSNQLGTIQVVSWTGQNIYNKHQEDIEEMLNGLVIEYH